MKSFFTDIFYHAVFAGMIGLLLAAPSPASAQATPIQTPQAYCAALGNPSCEVLNIDLGNMICEDVPNTACRYTIGMGIVKYCKNGQFKLKPLIISQDYISTGWTNEFEVSSTDAITGAKGDTAFSNASLCAHLP